MQSFITGTIVGAEVEDTLYGKVFRFGVLNGRTSQEFSCYAEQTDARTGERMKNPLFSKFSAMRNGESVVVLVNVAVAKDGKLGVYLRDVAPIEPELLGEFQACFTAKAGK